MMVKHSYRKLPYSQTISDPIKLTTDGVRINT